MHYVSELKKSVSEYFANQDFLTRKTTKRIIKDFDATINKWLKDPGSYSNEYVRRYYDIFGKDTDHERAFLLIKKEVEDTLWSYGYQPSIKSIENGIEVKITWDV